MSRKNCSRHLSLLYLQCPPTSPLVACLLFPAAFVFTRSAATVSLSVFYPLSTCILSEPLAGAFNRQWHLSPRAVMSLIHQWGMTGCMPPPSPATGSGGEGSHSARPERLVRVCAVQANAHGHRIWTLNHQSLMCVSPMQHFLHIPPG